jgi:endoglucanase
MILKIFNLYVIQPNPDFRKSDYLSHVSLCTGYGDLFNSLYMKRISGYYLLILVFIFITSTLNAQAPFSRGVNLTGWFQTDSPGQIQFTKFTKQDFADIKSLGCDVIRLPINMHAMTSGSPDYTFDPLYFSFLDSAVTWCEDLNIYLMLDNHSFDPSVNTQPAIVNILIKVWEQMAEHYKNRSDYVLYEVLNEPHGISAADWGEIQKQVISAIRAIDTKHTIVVGGTGYNSYNELNSLPFYTDTNLLYTFHFYDPFVFTHQGASWSDPSMVPLAGVPFPYNPSEMPLCPPSLQNTWIGSSLNNYPAEGNVSYIKNLIDKAVSFRDSRGVNVFCGEFGVYIPNSDNADRCNWYKVVKDYLDEKNIPWTIWDYKGGFGLFNKGSDEFFEHDLNVRLLDSLGFTVPEQTPFTIKPDSVGFMIYTDYTAHGIESSSYGAGPVNFYSSILPSNNSYCLSWYDFSQYNAVVFNFVPDKDLSRLVSENYALDFMIRGSEPGIKFEIRFKDTKTSEPGDHPWRMGTTIDEADAAWDRKWHHIHIPLSSFVERGSWDNNTWYTPVPGTFDWSKVDVLEISTEFPDVIGKKLWFDNIHITELDTAIVREEEALWIRDNVNYGNLDIKVVPNPVADYAEISFTQETEGDVRVEIYSVSGTLVRIISSGRLDPGSQFFTWDGRNENGALASSGIYFCRVMMNGYSGMTRIIKF